MLHLPTLKNAISQGKNGSILLQGNLLDSSLATEHIPRYSNFLVLFPSSIYIQRSDLIPLLDYGMIHFVGFS